MKKIEPGIYKETKTEKLAKTINDVLSDLIEKKRKDKGTSQGQQAKEMGINPSSLSKYVNGLSVPEATVLIEMAKYYNCTADYILGISDIKSPNIENIAIGKKLGLTEKTIKCLEYWNENLKEDSLVKVLNCFFETGYAEKLFKGFLLYFFSENKGFSLTSEEDNRDVRGTKLQVHNTGSLYTTFPPENLKYMYKQYLIEVIDNIRKDLIKNNVKVTVNSGTSWFIDTTLKSEKEV